MLTLGLSIGKADRFRGDAVASGPILRAPRNAIRPVISGRPEAQSALTVDRGVWVGEPTAYAYQWLRDGAPIAGARATRYEPGPADVGATIGCSVSASNDQGVGTALAAPVGPVAGEGAAPDPTPGPDPDPNPDPNPDPDPTGFVHPAYAQTLPLNLLDSAFARGDEAPSAANGGSWQGGTGLVSGGTINDDGGAAFGARFDLGKVGGGVLAAGRSYIASAEVVAIDPPLTGNRVRLTVQGGTLLSTQDMYGLGGLSVTGLASFSFEAIDAHSFMRFDKQSNLAASLDNVSLYDITDRLQKPIDLYILAGQSNVVGNETFLDDAPGLTMTEAAFDPRVLYVPARDANGDGGTGMAKRGRPHLLVNPLTHQTANRGVGPGVAFASALADQTPQDRQIVVVAAGWAGEALVNPDGRWNRNGTAPEAYDGLLEVVDTFLADHPNATVRGMLWCQGEADRSEGPAATQNYVAAFKNELLGPLRAKWGGFPCVILSMREDIGSFTNIDAAHQQIASADPLVGYVRGVVDADSDGVNEALSDDVAKFGEPVHYTREQQRQNGLRCAEAMAPLLNAAWS